MRFLVRHGVLPLAPLVSQEIDALVVRDAKGVKWSVKLGIEARPEVAASRLVWAVGYLAVFGAGTIAGMMLITVSIAAPSLIALRQFGFMHRALRIASGDTVHYDLRMAGPGQIDAPIVTLSTSPMMPTDRPGLM